MRSCGTCERIRQRDAGEAPLWDSISRSAAWDVVHAYDTSLLGWTVLVPRRHVEAIDELETAEVHELGELMRNVSVFLKRHLGCRKTYVMQFAEHPQHPHVHFHLVPRMPDLPAASIGANIFSCLGVDEEVRVPEHAMNEFGERLRSALITADPLR